MKSRDAAIYRLDKGKQVYKTVFVGQFADDYGGPYRSSIVQMCQELQDWVLPLFMPVRVRAIWWSLFSSLGSSMFPAFFGLHVDL
jgi:hypothetical protein